MEGGVPPLPPSGIITSPDGPPARMTTRHPEPPTLTAPTDITTPGGNVRSQLDTESARVGEGRARQNKRANGSEQGGANNYGGDGCPCCGRRAAMATAAPPRAPSALPRWIEESTAERAPPRKLRMPARPSRRCRRSRIGSNLTAQLTPPRLLLKPTRAK